MMAFLDGGSSLGKSALTRSVCRISGHSIRQRGRQVKELFAQVAHEHGAAVIVVTHDHRSLDIFDTTHEMEDGVITKNELTQFKSA